MSRFVFVCIAVFLVCVTVGSVSAEELVLANGTRMEIAKASIEGKLVYVTFASGQMQAYPVEEVDLQASGLLPEVVPEEKPEKRTRNIADARSPDTGRSGATITDQDVGHVDPTAATPEKQEEAQETGEAVPAVSLRISDTKQQIAGNVINLTGKVQNSGTETVAMIMIIAKAVDEKGVEIGKGSTSISQELAAGEEIVFAVSFPFQGRIADIKVSAQASMANFEFMNKPVEPDAADAGK